MHIINRNIESRNKNELSSFSRSSHYQTNTKQITKIFWMNTNGYRFCDYDIWLQNNFKFKQFQNKFNDVEKMKPINIFAVNCNEKRSRNMINVLPCSWNISKGSWEVSPLPLAESSRCNISYIQDFAVKPWRLYYICSIRYFLYWYLHWSPLWENRYRIDHDLLHYIHFGANYIDHINKIMQLIFIYILYPYYQIMIHH